jgi:hypothetical protein
MTNLNASVYLKKQNDNAHCAMLSYTRHERSLVRQWESSRTCPVQRRLSLSILVVNVKALLDKAQDGGVISNNHRPKQSVQLIPKAHETPPTQMVSMHSQGARREAESRASRARRGRRRRRASEVGEHDEPLQERAL